MSSAAEAELGALYINAKEAVYIRTILEDAELRAEWETELDLMRNVYDLLGIARVRE